MAQRYFDLDEAHKLLPKVEQQLQAIIQSNEKLQKMMTERAEFADRVSRTGGQVVDIGYWLARKQEQEILTDTLRSAAQWIEESGCLVKDIELGLIDFPCELDGSEFYLCWKLGEPSITFWHDPHEGFAGRKPIDSAMMARLNGSRPI
jgi:hypothetical protein